MAAAVASATTSGQISSCGSASGRGSATATASAAPTSPDTRPERSSMRTRVRTERTADKAADDLLAHADGLDHDILHGHVAHRRTFGAGLGSCLHPFDLSHDVHSRNHLAEHRISRRAVEEAVVVRVDEELVGGAVRIVGARHGDGPWHVLEPVARLVLDRRVLGALL